MKYSDALKIFIIDNFLFEDDGSLKEDTSFIENGIIDSTGILELIAFVESSFAITVEDEELIPENFDSIAKISAFIEKKCNTDTLN